MLGGCPSFGSFVDSSTGDATAVWTPSGLTGTLVLTAPPSGACGAGSGGSPVCSLAFSGARTVRIEATATANDDFSDANSLFVAKASGGPSLQIWKTANLAVDPCAQVPMIQVTGTNPLDVSFGCAGDALTFELQRGAAGASATFVITLFACAP